MSAQLRKALRKVRDAEKSVTAVLIRDYPPGAPVSWRKATRQRGAVVMNTNYGDRIKVRNESTGKEYWIHAGDIVS